VTFDWRAEIGRLIAVKQEIATHDLDKIFPWHLPEVAASTSQIIDAEEHSGIRLPSEFKDFLAVANGWKCFLIRADLFGTEQIKRNKVTIRGRGDVRRYLESNRIPQDKVLPIGSSGNEQTVFLLYAADYHPFPGGIVWLDGEEIERFESFGHFFKGVVQNNVELCEEVKAGKWSLA
jgi:hypothetical protein